MLLLRRARGVLVTGVLWAIVWAVFGCVLMGVLRVILGLRPVEPSFTDLLAGALSFFGVSGAVSGAVFAISLAIAERRRRIEDLSMKRVALWGAIGGVTIPAVGTAMDILTGLARSALQPDLIVIFGIAALLGSFCSTATLALARRGKVVSEL